MSSNSKCIVAESIKTWMSNVCLVKPQWHDLFEKIIILTIHHNKNRSSCPKFVGVLFLKYQRIILTLSEDAVMSHLHRAWFGYVKTLYPGDRMDPEFPVNSTGSVRLHRAAPTFETSTTHAVHWTRIGTLKQQLSKCSYRDDRGNAMSTIRLC